MRRFPRAGRMTLSCCVALGLAAVLVLSARNALACSCLAQSFEKRFTLSDNVFTAIITGERAEQAADGTVEVQSDFRITRAYKGDQPFGALVSHRSDAASCGVELEVGVEYLFMTADSGYVGFCQGSKRKESADPEIASLDSYVSGNRPSLAEPWYFSSYEEGCTLTTSFDIADDLPQGALTLDGWRPGQASTAFGRAKLDVFFQSHSRLPHLSIVMDGISYEPAVNVLSPIGDRDLDGPVLHTYRVIGEEAHEILRGTLTAEALQVRLHDDEGDFDLVIDVSTANLADAGTGSKMLECIGSP